MGTSPVQRCTFLFSHAQDVSSDTMAVAAWHNICNYNASYVLSRCENAKTTPITMSKIDTYAYIEQSYIPNAPQTLVKRKQANYAGINCTTIFIIISGVKRGEFGPFPSGDPGAPEKASSRAS